MLDDGAAEPAGEDAREFGAPLVGAHAARVPPVVRLDVVVVVHGHHGDPAKRGPSVMSYDVFGRVLRKVMTRGSTGTGRVASRWRIWGTLHTPPRERRQRGRGALSSEGRDGRLVGGPVQRTPVSRDLGY
jgi:hypothetical protein